MQIFNRDKSTLENLSAFHTANEIAQQPSTWLKTLNQVKEESQEILNFISQIINLNDYRIILAGAGTSEFVGNALYSYLNKQYKGKVLSYGTTDIVASPYNYLWEDMPTLLISYGRSGNSKESVGACDVADKIVKNVKHLVITCNNEGALSKRAEEFDNYYAINLTPETHDLSFAMTSSFTCMALATILALDLNNIEKNSEYVQAICDGANQMINDGYKEVQEYLKSYNFKNIVYLGNDALKGFAQEGALKMLELTAGDVFPMFDTPLGFRHGPKSIINDETLCIIWSSDDDYSFLYDFDLIKEISTQRKQNHLVVVGNQERKEIEGLVNFSYFYNQVSLDNVFIGFLDILFAQIVAFEKSLSLNITPDNPCPSGEVNRVAQGVTLYPLK